MVLLMAGGILATVLWTAHLAEDDCGLFAAEGLLRPLPGPAGEPGADGTQGPPGTGG